MRIIGGSARGRKLVAPPDAGTRPALDRLRESLFSHLGERVEGSRVLDLFAGVGAFGLEALSRGARHATFVDRSVRVLDTLERNIESLGFRRQSTVLCGDALVTPDLGATEQPFDLVFIDPPFALVHDREGAAAVLARAAEVLRGRASNETTTVVLRLPSEWREPLPFPHHEERDYGSSRVVLLRRSDLAPAPE